MIYIENIILDECKNDRYDSTYKRMMVSQFTLQQCERSLLLKLLVRPRDVLRVVLTITSSRVIYLYVVSLKILFEKKCELCIYM